MLTFSIISLLYKIRNWNAEAPTSKKQSHDHTVVLWAASQVDFRPMPPLARSTVVTWVSNSRILALSTDCVHRHKAFRPSLSRRVLRLNVLEKKFTWEAEREGRVATRWLTPLMPTTAEWSLVKARSWKLSPGLRVSARNTVTAAASQSVDWKEAGPGARSWTPVLWCGM